MLQAETHMPDGETPNDQAKVISVFRIGPDKKMKLSLTYPINGGKNFAEIFRTLDAFKLSAGKAQVSPDDWQRC